MLVGRPARQQEQEQEPARVAEQERARILEQEQARVLQEEPARALGQEQVPEPDWVSVPVLKLGRWPTRHRHPRCRLGCRYHRHRRRPPRPPRPRRQQLFFSFNAPCECAYGVNACWLNRMARGLFHLIEISNFGNTTLSSGRSFDWTWCCTWHKHRMGGCPALDD